MPRRWSIALALAGLLAGCDTQISPSAYDDFLHRESSPAQRAAAGDWSPSSPTSTQPATAPADTGWDIQITEQSGLNDYLAYAALHSPRMRSAFAAWQAAVEQVPQDRALGDPIVTYRLFLMSATGKTDRNVYEINQVFPWLGKLELRGDIASSGAQAARHRFDAQWLKVSLGVQQAYAELYYLQRETRITQQNIELVNQAESVARARYAASAAGHPDVIRAQVEQGRLADRLRTLQNLRAPTAARLNAALNRPPGAPVGEVTQLAIPHVPFSDEQLLAWAAEGNPELAALDREVIARRQEIALARKAYYPDVMLGAGFENDEEEGDMVMGMVSLNLPIWYDKLAAGVRQARWRHLQAIQDRQAMLNSLDSDAERALFELRDALRKQSLYRDTLIPKARQGLQASLSAFRTGGQSFLDYLDAQRVLLEFELSYERALADSVQRLAELEMLTGRPLRSAGAEGPPQRLAD